MLSALSLVVVRVLAGYVEKNCNTRPREAGEPHGKNIERSFGGEKDVAGFSRRKMGFEGRPRRLRESRGIIIPGVVRFHGTPLLFCPPPHPQWDGGLPGSAAG